MKTSETLSAMSIKPAPTLTRAATLPERDASEQLASSTNSKQAYTTEIVKALGGPAGDVVQDVPCSYQRQTGRLYSSTVIIWIREKDSTKLRSSIGDNISAQDYFAC